MTPEEHTALRQHRITASRAADLLSGNYRVWNRLARDMREPPTRILGQKCGVPALDWGTENEPWVRAQVWEHFPNWEVEKVGFQTYHGEHPLLSKHVGASPDGLILPVRWGYEGKAPFNPENHDYYVTIGRVPDQYVPQVQFSLWVTGWSKWVFASGDPRRTDENRIMTAIADPDPALHQKFEELCLRFLETYTTGEDFKPVGTSAKALKEMFA